MMAGFDAERFAAECVAVESFLTAIVESEIRFHAEQWPTANDGTPTAVDILTALVNTLTDALDPDGAFDFFMPDVLRIADEAHVNGGE